MYQQTYSRLCIWRKWRFLHYCRGYKNTHEVWSGAVPIVQAVPVSNLNGLTVQAFAAFVLQGKADEIAETMSPGGSGDPYAVLDLMK